MKIELKKIEEFYYTNSMGDEKPLKEIDKRHLVNSFAKSIREERKDIEKILREEIIRRLKSQ